MAELKTKVNEASVAVFLAGVPDDAKRRDSQIVLEMMRQATGIEPKMWGGSIIGFGTYHYVGKSSEGDWFPLGLSPRKQALTLYVLGGWEKYTELRARLGRHSLGKGCMYIRRLQDVDTDVLKELIGAALADAMELAAAEARKQSKAVA